MPFLHNKTETVVYAMLYASSNIVQKALGVHERFLTKKYTGAYEKKSCVSSSYDQVMSK